jgi:hypothetical protein
MLPREKYEEPLPHSNVISAVSPTLPLGIRGGGDGGVPLFRLFAIGMFSDELVFGVLRTLDETHFLGPLMA